jgi:uncharacterized membrane protein (DUF4010 family)
MQNFLSTWVSPFMLSLIVSTGMGLIIGLEREFNSTKSNFHFAGIRTFPLMAIAGCLVSLLASHVNTPAILAVSIAAVLLFISVIYFSRLRKTDAGITTELSLFITFLIGIMAGFLFIKEALAAAVFTTLLLSLKNRFRSLVKSITEEELFAIIKFAILTLLILPFLPDKPMGPGGLLNPFEIGVVIVIVSTVNFIGYFLVRIVGSDKGLLLTAFLGGLFSSTAVTWVFSAGSRQHPELSKTYAGGIVLATTIMFLRVLLLCLIFNAAIFRIMILPCLLLAASGAVFLFFLMRKTYREGNNTKLQLGNPLNLANAIGFGVIYIAILLMTHYSDNLLGNQGFYITGFAAGFADLDAIAISSAKYGLEAAKLYPAATVIMLAFLSNTLTKSGAVIWRGSSQVKRIVLLSYGIMTVVGIGYFYLVGL